MEIKHITVGAIMIAVAPIVPLKIIERMMSVKFHPMNFALVENVEKGKSKNST